MPGLARDLQEELDADFTNFKLSDEQRELFMALLEAFRDLFVQTSLKLGRTDLLEAYINTGARPLVVSRIEGGRRLNGR
ncbi:hypothetical protein PI124_g16263 [Phytophthora idaei]|nr:hypothetical protein PI125_g21471 [Phytophthora idaei]KAG3135770.1 hypothetical protein PI126_g18102 [Phytophthora idaei]KAG3238781.1 hypothetical protein PI124_g16263 [Phytophthora idaei]